MRIFILGFILAFAGLSRSQTTNSSALDSQRVYDAPFKGQCRPNPQLCYYCSKLHNCAECIQDPDNCCYKPDFRLNEKGLTRKAIFMIKKLCSKPIASPQIIKKHCLARMKLNPFLKMKHKKSFSAGHFSEDLENSSTLEAGVTGLVDGQRGLVNSAEDATGTTSTTTEASTANTSLGMEVESTDEATSTTGESLTTSTTTTEASTANTSLGMEVDESTDEAASTTEESVSTTAPSSDSTTDLQQTSDEGAKTSQTTLSVIPGVNTDSSAVTAALTAEDQVTATTSESEETVNSSGPTQELQGISATTENPGSQSIIASTNSVGSTVAGSEPSQPSTSTSPEADGQTGSATEMEFTSMTTGDMNTLEMEINPTTASSNDIELTNESTVESSSTQTPSLTTSIGETTESVTSTSIPDHKAGTGRSNASSSMETNKVSPVKAEISNNCKKICLKSRRAQKCAKCIMDSRMCCFGAETGSFEMAVAQYEAAKSLCFL